MLRAATRRATKSRGNLPIKDHGGAKRLAYRADKCASLGKARQKVLTQGGSESSRLPHEPRRDPPREIGADLPPQYPSYILTGCSQQRLRSANAARHPRNEGVSRDPSLRNRRPTEENIFVCSSFCGRVNKRERKIGESTEMRKRTCVLTEKDKRGIQESVAHS